MNSTLNQTPKHRIAILQYNINKSGPTTYSLLSHPDSEKLAILAIQEQHYLPRTKEPLTHQSWTIIEAPRYENNQPRAAIYVNNRILSADAYQSIHYPSSDIIIIEIKVENNYPMLLVNIYNTKGTSLVNDLAEFLEPHLRLHR